MSLNISDARRKLDLLEQLKETPYLIFSQLVTDTDDVQFLNILEIENISAKRYIQEVLDHMEIFREANVILRTNGKLYVYVSALKFGTHQKFQEDDQIAEIDLCNKTFRLCEECIAGYQKVLGSNYTSDSKDPGFDENVEYTLSRRIQTAFSKLQSNNGVAIRIFDFLYYLLISRKKMEKQLRAVLKTEKKRFEYEKKFQKERMELQQYYQENFPKHLEQIRGKQQILDSYLSDLGYERV